MLANIFSIIILLGIYTTSVPLLWSVIARFAEEKTRRFKVLAILLGTVGSIIGLLLKFDSLVNIVYVLNGYIRLVLLIIIVVRSIQWKRI